MVVMEQGFHFENLLQQFFAGRLGFDALRRQTKALVEADPDLGPEFQTVLSSYVNLGRLPPDLATHLEVLFGTESAAKAMTMPPPLPQVSNMPLPAGKLAVFDDDADTSIDRRVDELVLNALLGDFKKFRRSERTEPKRPRIDQALDDNLKSFRGVRMRKEARLAETGQGRALSLDAPEAEIEHGSGDVFLGRFVLDAEIGAGGMGKVFKAVDRRRLEAGSHDPYVAIKLISAKFRDNPHALRALESEARKAQALAHPNIVTIYDFEREGRAAFIVMELLTGEALSQRLAGLPDRRMSLSDARPIVEGIAAGLANAHLNGVIHCDLKPANIFLTTEGGVKILDFGIATSTRRGAFAAEALGAMTIAYASPEILEGAPRDARDDIFALACIFYLMLTGKHPFDRKPATVARDQTLVPAPIPGVSKSAQAALFAGLAFEREKRPSKAVDYVASVYKRGLFQSLFG